LNDFCKHTPTWNGYLNALGRMQQFVCFWRGGAGDFWAISARIVMARCREQSVCVRCWPEQQPRKITWRFAAASCIAPVEHGAIIKVAAAARPPCMRPVPFPSAAPIVGSRAPQLWFLAPATSMRIPQISIHLKKSDRALYVWIR